MTRGGYSRGSVDVEADVAIADHLSFTRVQAHPNANLKAWPGMGRKCSLRIHDGGGCLLSTGEDHEEGVPLGPDLAAVVCPNSPAHDSALRLQHFDPSVTQLLDQERGVFDVGEEERDRPGGELTPGLAGINRAFRT